MATETDAGASTVPEGPMSPGAEQKSLNRSDVSVPLHILGRTVDDPTADTVGSGKSHQKPRLGVKVPYLNLTSQIVSHDEIAAELAERAEKKNPGMIDGSKMGDMIFTMKMTHRLVKSIKPVFPEKAQVPDQQFSSPEPAPVTPVSTPQPDSANNSTDKLDENSLQSQLMKTLEAENENESLPLDESAIEQSLSKKEVKKLKPLRKAKINVQLDRELEKKLALQQLQEFNLQKQMKKELKEKVKEELKEKSKEPKPKVKRSRQNKKLKNIVINRKLDETEAPILPYKSIARKHKVTIGVVPVNGSEATPKITANPSEVTEAPPEVPDLKMEKDNRYMKKYTNKRHSEDAMNGSNEIIDEIASEILDPTPKKKIKRSKVTNSSPAESDKASIGKRKSLRTIKPTEKVANKKAKRIVQNGSTSANEETQAQQLQESEAMEMETEVGTEAELQGVPGNALIDTSVEGGKKSKMMREIDRLLMDEGAINMLYSIEEKRSPKNTNQKANLLPSTRRKKKDLILKTKLVKNFVLKLSGSPKEVANKVQRKSNKHDEAEIDQSQNASGEPSESAPGASPKASSSSLPAEASRIIRRHSSSSSFSSAAGSPRRMSTDFEHPLPNLTPDAGNASGKKLKKKPKRGSSPKKDPVATASNAKDAGPAANHSAPIKMSIPVKNDVTTEMSKNFNKKPNTPKNVIRKTLYAEEKNSPNSPALKAAAAASSSAMPPPSVRSVPAATSTPVMKPITSQVVNVSHTRKNNSLFLESLANKEFGEKLDRLDTGSARLPPSPAVLPKVDCYQDITVKKMKAEHLMHIVLTPNAAKIKNALNTRVLREIQLALQQAESDKSIRAVLFTSIGSTFCQGIDFEAVIENDAEKRKRLVVDLAMAIRDFIYALGMFNKLLIAGVHGPAVGLGVMMLPYFDMVFASDKATFYTPYIKLGQVPEGAPALTMSKMLSNAATSELIYGCRQLTASEALRCGVVTRILWPDRFQEELMPIVIEISSHSAQAMASTKTLMRREMRAQLNMALAAECHLLVKNWNSVECQENFRKFLDDDSFWQITK